MKSIVLLSMFCSMMWSSVDAQILKPVKWSYAARKTSAKEATIYIKATMEKGWHIYSLDTPEGGPVGTSITFTPDRSYQLTGTVQQPKPASKLEKQFGVEVKYFENTVIFQQKIKLQEDQATARGEINFMVCSDQQCLPPSMVAFNVDIK